MNTPPIPTTHPRNTRDVTYLRDQLFDALAKLREAKDADLAVELERARATSELAKVIVDSARVENDFLKVTGAEGGSGFIPAIEEPAGGEQLALPAAAAPSKGPQKVWSPADKQPLTGDISRRG